MNIPEIAREALRVLDRDGWCKGSLQYRNRENMPRYPQGSHCLGGAWNIAHHGDPWWANNDCGNVYEPVADVIKAQYPEQLSAVVLEAPSLIMWLNDAPTTTEADVRAILEKLATS
jgi:hypothetical protein